MCNHSTRVAVGKALGNSLTAKRKANLAIGYDVATAETAAYISGYYSLEAMLMEIASGTIKPEEIISRLQNM